MTFLFFLWNRSTCTTRFLHQITLVSSVARAKFGFRRRTIQYVLVSCERTRPEETPRPSFLRKVGLLPAEPVGTTNKPVDASHVLCTYAPHFFEHNYSNAPFSLSDQHLQAEKTPFYRCRYLQQIFPGTKDQRGYLGTLVVEQKEPSDYWAWKTPLAVVKLQPSAFQCERSFGEGCAEQVSVRGLEPKIFVQVHWERLQRRPLSVPDLPLPFLEEYIWIKTPLQADSWV